MFQFYNRYHLVSNKSKLLFSR